MKTSLFKSLYFQVLTAIAIGILLGHFYPEIGEQMKPLGDGFVKLIKMIIAPVIFCTVVLGDGYRHLSLWFSRLKAWYRFRQLTVWCKIVRHTTPC